MIGSCTNDIIFMFFEQPKFPSQMPGTHNKSSIEWTGNIRQNISKRAIKKLMAPKNNHTYGWARSLWAFLGIAFLKDDIFMLAKKIHRTLKSIYALQKGKNHYRKHKGLTKILSWNNLTVKQRRLSVQKKNNGFLSYLHQIQNNY